MKRNENNLIFEQYKLIKEIDLNPSHRDLTHRLYAHHRPVKQNNNKALVKEINSAFKGIFNKFPLDHIDYMIKMAKDEGDSNATIMMEYPTDEAQEAITIEEVKSLEERLHAICTKYTNYIRTEIVSSGYGYELYFLMSVDGGQDSDIEEANENNGSMDSWSIQSHITLKWLPAPKNPNGILVDHDTGDKISKGAFWESDIRNQDPTESMPIFGVKDKSNTWVFEWDVGTVGGFIEGDDFTFGG